MLVGGYRNRGFNSRTNPGEAALPLDARVLGVSHPVLLSVKDKQGRSRGFLRVEAFWVDEAKPRKETGEFYYRVRTVSCYRSSVAPTLGKSMSQELCA